MRLSIFAFCLLSSSVGFAAPGWDLGGDKDYVSGGVAAGDIHTQGYKLTLDADMDTYWYSASDDTISGVLGGIGIISLTVGGSTFGHNLTIGGANTFAFSGLSKITSPSNGTLQFTDTAGTAFTGLYLGGTSATDLLLKKSGTQLQLRLGDDSDYANLRVSAVVVEGTTQTNAFIATGNGRVSGTLKMGPSGDIGITAGTGSPEASFTAAIGSVYMSTDGTYGTEAYVKSAGTGNTGYSKVVTIPVDGVSFVWDEVYTDALSVKVPAAGGPDFEAAPAGSATYSYCFPDSSDTYVYFNIALPHGYQDGTDFILHAHWAPTTTNTGDLDLQYAYSECIAGNACTASSSGSVQQAGGGVAYEPQSLNILTVTGTNYSDGDYLKVTLMRDGDDAGNDTFTGKACLELVGIHFKRDDLGTRGANPH